MNIEMAFAFVLYIAALGAIGFAAYKKSLQSTDFSLGGRSLNYWVTALAAHASDMSGWLFMGFPAAVYAKGVVEAWTAIGLTFFMLLNWYLVAPKLRQLSEQYNSSTLPSFFQQRFNDQSGMLRLTSAFFCLFFFMFYIASGFVTLGTLFEAIFNFSYLTGICIGSLVVFYMLLGGFLSIAWIDFFQGIFLLGMIVLVPLVAVFHMGGITHVVSILQQKQIPLNLFNECSLTYFLNVFMLAASWGLGYFGMPHIITKFMGIKDVREVKKAMGVGISWLILTLTAAVAVGLVGAAYFAAGIDNPQHIFVMLTKELFSPFIAGLILCAILASAINVMGAQVLACASVLAEDFYKKCIKQKDPVLLQKHIQRASRLSVLAICFLAFMYAYYHQTTSLYDLVAYAWTGLGASFGPLVLVSLHTKINNRYAAFFGIVVGGCCAALWPLLTTTIPAMIPAFFASLLAILFVDRLTATKLGSI